jgi:hypothetical protein
VNAHDMTARYRARKYHALVILCLAAAACQDGFFAEPAEPRAGIAVTLASSAAVRSSDPAAAFDKADAARVRVLREANLVLDTVVAFAPAEEVSLRVAIDMREGQRVHRVEVELRRGADVLFQGSTTTTLTESQTTKAEVALTPVAVGIQLPATVAPLTAIGDTVTIAGTTVFATGDALEGMTLTWSSSNTSVATIDNSGRITAVGEGTTQIQAVAGTLTATVPLQVAATVSSVAVTPPIDTVLVGRTAPFSALARDRRGNALARTVAWSSSDPAVATVDAAGVVTGLAAGTAIISATAGGVVGTTSAVVRDPCLESTTIAMGQTVSGVLGDDSCVLANGLAAAYVKFTLPQPQEIYVFVGAAVPRHSFQITRDSDGAVAMAPSILTDSTVSENIPAHFQAGTYTIRIGQINGRARGPYSVGVMPRAPGDVGCVPAGGGISTMVDLTNSAAITDADCVSPVDATYRYDEYQYTLTAGTTYHVAVTGIQKRLEIRSGATLHAVQPPRDQPSMDNPSISFTPPTTRNYTVSVIGQPNAGILSAYTVTVRPQLFTLFTDSAAVVRVEPGTSRPVTVNVARTDGFNEAITLSVSNLPPGITATPVSIPAGATGGTITLTASSTMDPVSKDVLISGVSQSSSSSIPLRGIFALDMAGTWSGTYAWNCAQSAGSTPVSFVFVSALPNAHENSGTVTTNGGSTSVLSRRYSSATFSSFGFITSGTSDPAGSVIEISWSTGGGVIGNDFTGRLEGRTLSGTTVNGGDGGAAGCSANFGPAGSFSITKQ